MYMYVYMYYVFLSIKHVHVIHEAKYRKTTFKAWLTSRVSAAACVLQCTVTAPTDNPTYNMSTGSPLLTQQLTLSPAVEKRRSTVATAAVVRVISAFQANQRTHG